MADRDLDRDPVEQLAEQFAQEHRQGRAPSIDDYADRYPELADEIRDLFPALMVMEGLSPAGDETWLQDDVATHTGWSLPENFGDYKIVREVGRGGMGIVYEAVQQSLSRRVALKVLPVFALGNLERRERFEVEAHAAARLDHPHIVPVFEVGEHDGYPFFSMKLIEGDSLAAKLAEGPLPPRETAELLLPVCRAIEAAHQRGVLHRDLKPANIMIDADNEPQVTDFGLAKLFEVGRDVSETNASVGTPSYMAPEQALGKWQQIGVRTDVYGLGAIMYHCLTARPPFQAAMAVQTLRQVTTQDPVPLRQLNSSIDRDLETICIKCLSKEPAGRYGSAAELADDLQRYLKGEAIEARPLSTVVRSIRWCKREPARAAAALLVVLIALISSGAWFVTEGYRRREKQALQESHQSHLQTREVVDFFLTRISEDELLNQPGMQVLRRDLLERARLHYARFLDAQRAKGSSARRGELADAYFRLGLVELLMGKYNAAERQFNEARKIQTALVKQHGDDVSLTALGKTLTRLGEIHYRRDEFDQAAALYTETEQMRRGLVEQHPQNRAYGRLLANATMHLGLIAKARQDYNEARKLLRAAETRRRELLKQRDDADIRRDLGMGLYNLGLVEMEAAKAAVDDSVADKNFEFAEASLREAATIFGVLVDEAPQDLGNQFRLARCWRMLADVQTRPTVSQDLATEYKQSLQKSLPELERLAYENATVLDYQDALAAIYLSLGRSEFFDQRFDEAINQFREAKKHLELLVRLAAAEPSHREDLGITLRSIGEIEALRGHYEIGRQNLDGARQIFSQLVAQFPQQTAYQQHRDACGLAIEQIETIMREPQNSKPSRDSPVLDNSGD